MITKTRYPGICNNCGRKCEYQIRAGIHVINLCGTCLDNLALEARTLIVKSGNEERIAYNNSLETGLIQPHCSTQMIAEVSCDGDPACRKCWKGGKHE